MNDATRADLHDALAKPAVVEQQLALQYLYTAASLRWIPPADLAPEDPSQVDYEVARGAAKTLLLLARQEMEHQSWVLNLLLATGAAPSAFDDRAMPMELPVGGPALLPPGAQQGTQVVPDPVYGVSGGVVASQVLR